MEGLEERRTFRDAPEHVDPKVLLLDRFEEFSEELVRG